MNSPSLLQPIWDWMLRQLGVNFFDFPLYYRLSLPSSC